MAIADRLRQLAQIKGVAPSEEAPAVARGRHAENVLSEMVAEHFSHRDAHLFTGRRIPSKRQGRRREIDVIIATPQMLHLLEVKNWVGQLTVEDGVWRQIRRGGEVLEHRNVVEQNIERRDAVVEYLRDCGVKIDDEFVRERIASKVIFMNPRLQIDPTIQQHPDVLTRNDLDQFLERQHRPGLGERLFAALVDCCLDAESKWVARLSKAVFGRLPSQQFERIVECLSKTGTWDYLHLYGTKIVAGDLIKLQIGADVYRREQLESMADDRPIRFKWTRNRLLGLAKSVTGLGALGRMVVGRKTFQVGPADSVTFHVVGEEERTTRSVAEVELIELG